MPKKTTQPNRNDFPQPPQKIVVVVGPTASGKSEFAIKLAKKYNGEIISADSQQVYKGLDIGTGKVPGTWRRVSLVVGRWSLAKDKRLKTKDRYIFVYKNIAHHCIDFVSPKRQYTVADFKRDGERALQDILARGKTPIICGGTGQYVDALLMDQALPEVPPNLKLRTKLEKKTTTELFTELKKKDPARAASIDPHNPRRLIRALEIIAATGKPVPPLPSPGLGRAREARLAWERSKTIAGTTLDLEIHYLNPPREVLYKRIEKRLKGWLKQGLLEEIKKLHNPPAGGGVTWKRIEQFGLEYKHIAQYLRSGPPLFQGGARGGEKSTRNFLNSPLYTESLKSIKNYAKRQQTWFKKYAK